MRQVPNQHATVALCNKIARRFRFLPLFGATTLAALVGCAATPPEEEVGIEWGSKVIDPDRCERRSAANVPFGSHKFAYANGSILPNHVDQAELDEAVKRAYDQWKSTYVERACGGAVVKSNTASDKRTVSEAQGYGMIILAYMAGYDPEAKELFDGMWHYADSHPAQDDPHLMAWAQDKNCANSDKPDSATDGDLDIAYAMLLADKQWGSSGDIDYRTQARAVIDAIWRHNIDESGRWVLLGSWVGEGTHYYHSTRSSDFMPDHLATFARVTGNEKWKRLNDSLYDIMAIVQRNHSSTTGLLPDFIKDPGAEPRPHDPNFLENPTDGAYSYNACRDPWRIAVHYLTSGDQRAKDIVNRINAWLTTNTGNNPLAIKSGYHLDGRPLRDWGSMAFTSPFAVGAMVDAQWQEWLNKSWDLVSTNIEGNYYSDTLQVLSLIALSGNWWSPTMVSCP